MKVNDWRLPDIDELSGLLWGEVDRIDGGGYCKQHPDKALYSFLFRDSQVACWSYSADEGFRAWMVDFRFGWAGTLSKGLRHHVRLVREGVKCKVKRGPRYSISDCGTYVVDTKFCLEWKLSIEDGKFTHREAVEQYRHVMLA